MKSYLFFLLANVSFSLLTENGLVAVEGEDQPTKCSNDILQIYLEPSPDFSPVAKPPSSIQKQVCPQQQSTCCSDQQFLNLKNQFILELKKFQKVYDFNSFGWKMYKSFNEEDMRKLFATEEFQSERFQKCMGHNWNQMGSFIDQLKLFTEDQILKILQKVNLEMAKYYSGMACEFCSPRAVDGVDIEIDPQTGDKNIVRVRHEWPSTYQKVYIIQQSLKIIEFIYPLGMVSKAGYCQLHDTDQDWDEIEQGFENLDDIRRIIYLFCENEQNFQEECLQIFLKTDPYDSDKSYQSIFTIIDHMLEGFNYLQSKLYPDRKKFEYENDWDGYLEFYKKRPESKFQFQQGKYLQMDEYSMHIFRNSMDPKYWSYGGLLRVLFLGLFLI